jgi:hypothetical protein
MPTVTELVWTSQAGDFIAFRCNSADFLDFGWTILVTAIHTSWVSGLLN